MIRDQLAVYELLRDIIKGKTGAISKVTYKPQKPAFPVGDIEQKFPRSTPEEQGVSSRYLASFVKEVVNKKETDIHNIMVFRNGHVIGEYSFAPYQREIWHISHSLCKSITGMAIGLLISEGKLSLDDKVVKLLSKKSLLGSVRQKNITVKHLLTMTSGVSFNELGIVSGDEWVREYLNASVSAAPGEKFEYNSMNSYILSAIVTEITGQSMAEYLKPRLFEPLGITKIFWESCPKGVTKGGWGLFLCQEDAAKLGQLYLQNGQWKGQQIIPKSWVSESIKKHEDTPADMGGFGYGYQMWCAGRANSFNFNGMLGQNVIVYPDLEMVIVTNAGSDELFQNCELIKVIRKYFEEDFSPAKALDVDPVGAMYLGAVSQQMKESRGIVPETGRGIIRSGGWSKGRQRRARRLSEQSAERRMQMLHGNEYRLNVKQVGIFPLIMQVFHNNFTDGIETIGFRFSEGTSYLILKEGEDELRLAIGFRKAETAEISIHGEPYLVAVKGKFARNEYEEIVLLLDIAYLEEAARREIKITFKTADKIEVTFDETPGKKLIGDGLGEVVHAASMTKLHTFIGLESTELPEMLIARTVSPVISGILVREYS